MGAAFGLLGTLLPARADRDEGADAPYAVRALVGAERPGRQVGDVVTVEIKTSAASERVSTSTDGEEHKSSETQSVQARYVERLDGEQSDGEWTRTIHVAEWSSTQDDASDDSLTGVTLSVTGARWRVVDGPQRQARAARAWIADELTASQSLTLDDLRSPALFPETPVAVGAAWDLTPEGVAVLLGRFEGRPLKTSDAEGVGRLVSVSGDGDPETLTVAFHVEARVTSMARGEDNEVPTLDGSRLVLDVSGCLATGGHTGAQSLGQDLDISLVFDGPAESAESRLSWSANASKERSETRGGEIPEPPK